MIVYMYRHTLVHYNYVQCLFSSGAINVIDQRFFSEGRNLAVLRNVACTGNEMDLLRCGHERIDEVLNCKTAGVVCQG